VVAYLALVVALSGSAYALGKGAVGTKQLKNNAVTSKKIRNGQVRTQDLADGSVTAAKLAGVTKKVLYARVKGSGQLVDGDALAVNRFSTGSYYVTFPPPIDKCAASATSSAFEGFDGSLYRLWSQVSIGTVEGGGYGKSQVLVNLFDSSGSEANSSFTLILVCPT
jgi:hypothetical protein